MNRFYTPSQGDIVLIGFPSHQGHEQAGHRPALILSPKAYNTKTGLALFCPITSKQKNYPYEVPLPDTLTTKGVVLSDQIKNLAWQDRQIRFLEKANPQIANQVIQKFITLLEGNPDA